MTCAPVFHAPWRSLKALHACSCSHLPTPLHSFSAGTWRKQDYVGPTVSSGITKISAFEP